MEALGHMIARIAYGDESKIMRSWIKYPIVSIEDGCAEGDWKH